MPVLIAVLLIAAIAAGCTMTGAKQKDTTPDTTVTAEAGTTSNTASARRDAILAKLDRTAGNENLTDQAANGFMDYLLAHYDSMAPYDFFTDHSFWELATSEQQDLTLTIYDDDRNTLDVISYNAQYNVANDAAYRCSIASSSSHADSAVLDYTYSTYVLPGAQFAQYLTEHGKEWQNSDIWDYDTVWSLRKLEQPNSPAYLESPGRLHRDVLPGLRYAYRDV